MVQELCLPRTYSEPKGKSTALNLLEPEIYHYLHCPVGLGPALLLES